MIRFTEGMSLETYLADEKTRFAVMRGFEMMGEAARQLPDEIRSANPDIPWPLMTAIRNRVAHGYFGIDDTILFTTVAADIKPLLANLERVAHEHDAES